MSSTTYDMFGSITDNGGGNLEIIDTSTPDDDIVGYLVNGAFICTWCVGDEYSGRMEEFWADNPIPFTYEKAIEKEYICEFSEYHKGKE